MEKEGIEENKGKLNKFFTHPAVGITGTVASIVGILLAIYFYLQTEKVRGLAYYINPVKAVVVKADETSNLSVTHNNKLVKTDITAVQIAIWNQGELAIKKDNILEPITIYTKNKIPILEATIRMSTRKVVGLKLDQSTLNEGRLGISWNIMEKNDGGIIQLIYAGVPKTEIGLKGIVEGQKQTNKLEFEGEIKSAQEQITAKKRETRASALSFIVLGLMFFILGMRIRRLKDKREFLKLIADYEAHRITDEKALMLKKELLTKRYRLTKMERKFALFNRRIEGYSVPFAITLAMLLFFAGVIIFLSSATPSLPFNF